MLLGRKILSPGDNRRYTIDADAWLDTTETISSVAFVVDTGPATAVLGAIAGDGKSFTFFVAGALLTYPLFNIAVQITSSAGQIVNDHVEVDVIAP